MVVYLRQVDTALGPREAMPVTLVSATSAASPFVAPIASSGDVAHDAVDSGAPMKIGGRAVTEASGGYSAVASGDRADAAYTVNGYALTAVGDANGIARSLLTSADAVVAGASSNRGLSTIPFGMAFNDTTWDRIRGNVSGLVVQQHAMASSRWQYAGATGGITDTADVALMAAGGAGVRNYLTGLQFFNSAAVASEVVIKDGSTVIWRGFAPASMTQPVTVNFAAPLKGTANTALNVAMLTTATATRVSAQGFQGI